MLSLLLLPLLPPSPLPSQSPLLPLLLLPPLSLPLLVLLLLLLLLSLLPPQPLLRLHWHVRSIQLLPPLQHKPQPLQLHSHLLSAVCSDRRCAQGRAELWLSIEGSA